VAPREHFSALLKQELLEQADIAPAANLTTNLADQGAAQLGVAFLFGSERFGMRNEDVYRCHACLSIPSNPQFGSLNIGAAIQVIAYEWRLALGGFGGVQAQAAPPASPLADAAQVSGMLAHLEQALVDLEFLDPAAPKKLMPRLNQLFNRGGVSPEEVHIVRGIAKAIIQMAARPKGPPESG
jgi:tRNA/rRNA methyltransferase